MAQTRKVLKFSQEKGQGLEVFEEEAPKTSEENGRGKMLQVVSIASELGFAISLPIAGGAFLGQLIDSKFGTTPRMTLSFIFIGVFLAAANIYFIVRETRQK